MLFGPSHAVTPTFDVDVAIVNNEGILNLSGFLSLYDGNHETIKIIKQILPRKLF